MESPVSREKEPSAFAWIISGALGVVLGGAAWAAGRTALRRKAAEAGADDRQATTPAPPSPPRPDASA